MDAQTADFTPIRFSTLGLREADRIPFFRDFIGPAVCHLDIEPSDGPFHADMTVRRMPGLDLVSCRTSPMRLSRTAPLLADGNDNIAVFMSSSGGTARQRGREITHRPGDAIVVTSAEASACTFPSPARYRGFHVSRAALASMVEGLDNLPLRRIPVRTAALQHLLRYAGFLLQEAPPATPELARISALHLCDLLALTIGATREAAAAAEGRGLRAVRLAAIKADVVEHLDQPGLTISAMAARQGITPRYVQILFASEGTTFSQFVLLQRLARMRRLLADPRFIGRSIGALALEAGFGDVSYFNRMFRRRYDATPSDIREEARRRNEMNRRR